MNTRTNFISQNIFKTRPAGFPIPILKDLILILLGILLMAWAVNSVIAQTQEKDEIIKIDTNLVSLKVRATDKKGRVVALNPAQLKVVVDNQIQEFDASLGNVEHFNVLIDASSSMRNSKISKVIEAVGELINSAKSNQTFSVYYFANQINYLGEFQTYQATEIKLRLKKILIKGETALYDAVEKVLSNSQNDSRNTALIIFTDGDDSASKVSPETLSRHLSVRNNLAYLIVLDEKMACREDSSYCDSGQKVAEKSANRFQEIFQSVIFLVKDKEELYQLAKSIPNESGLLNISFMPNEATDREGKHSIKILSNRDDLRLFYRQSYFASVTFQSQVVPPAVQNSAYNFKDFPKITNLELLIKDYQAKSVSELVISLNKVKPDSTSEVSVEQLPEDWKKLLVPANARLIKVGADIEQLLGSKIYTIKQINSATPVSLSDSNVLILVSSEMLKIADDDALEAVILHEMAHGLFCEQSVQAKQMFNDGVRTQDVEKMDFARQTLAEIEIKCDLIAAKLLISQNKSTASYCEVLKIESKYQDLTNMVYHPQVTDRIRGVEFLAKK